MMVLCERATHKDVRRPSPMKRDWVYFMLMDRSGMVIGFSRERGRATQFADLRTDRWFREPILYDDRIILRNPPEGLRTLRACR